MIGRGATVGAAGETGPRMRSRPLLAPAACRCGCESRRPLLPNQFCGGYVAGVKTIFFAEQCDDAGNTLDIVAVAGEGQQQAFVSNERALVFAQNGKAKRRLPTGHDQPVIVERLLPDRRRQGFIEKSADAAHWVHALELSAILDNAK